jgi:magnesium transporter
MKKKINYTTIRKLVSEKNYKEVKKVLEKWLSPELVPEIADFIAALSDEEKGFVFSALPEALAVTTFKVLDLAIQKAVIKNLPHEQSARVLNNLQPDDRTEFLSELPSRIVQELLKVLSDEERVITLKQLGYPEHSVGRLMTPDYVAIKGEWTVQQVLDYVRKNGKDKETINVLYVTNDEGVLIDDIRIREFLFVETSKKVSDLTDHKYISLHAYDDEETAIKVFQQNDRVALPVTDDNGILLGIVTIDDVLRLAQKEVTEDIHKIGGVEVLDEPYMNVPFFKLMKKRSGWLVILFLGEMLTATAMSFFEDEIAKAVVLALFVPLIISSGGNSGSQASTLIIRALALGEVTLKDWWRIMRREIFSGLFLGSVLGVIGFIRIATWTLFTNIYGVHWLLVALVVCFSLIGVVLWGTLSGSMLPLVLRKLGADPAVSSAPFVATLVDVTGLVIYFSVALIIMRGTLL